MSQDFTIQDIKDFMLDICGFKWYGEIYDDELGQYRTAKIEDFNEIKRSSLLVVKIRSEAEKKYYDSTRIQQLGVTIFGDTFRISRGRDYSNEWQNFKNERKESNNAVDL